MKTTMETGTDNAVLRRCSLLFWFTLLVPVASIAVGINVIIGPVGASPGYGVPIHDSTAFRFMWVKEIRYIFLGVVVLTFLLRGDRRTIAILFAFAIFIPFADGLVILRHIGFAPPIYIHWGTALYMTIIAAFLLSRKNS